MRRALSASLVALALALAATAGAGRAPAAGPRVVGAPSGGRLAIEYVGRLAQAGAQLTAYGYLTHIDGVNDADLFSDPNPRARNEQTARFTFVAAALPRQGFQVPNPAGTPTVFDLDSAGSETFYFSAKPAKRAWSEPATFASGDVIASYAVRFQDSVAALVPLDPNRGVVDIAGDLCQQSAPPFALGGENIALGKAGTLARTTAHGWSVRTSDVGPTSVSMVAGNVIVTGKGSCG
jgi:hypothetical protein